MYSTENQIIFVVNITTNFKMLCTGIICLNFDFIVILTGYIPIIYKLVEHYILKK